MDNNLKKLTDMLELPSLPDELKEYLTELLEECEGNVECAAELYDLYESIEMIRSQGLSVFFKSIKQINEFIEEDMKV